ncbi:serine/threonine-protein kinase pakC-like [Macadamia integrifolia]|uniref:serine/threonine-protein kinase pakC-like n=1 Tax=Macadamia integrifolia TaxID=60698 RepID=UPI001C4F2CA1|nr:serine/threonine-protein kinase pakC-like [Macadamia integrifolia]
MDFSSPRGTRKGFKRSELYSTVLIHGDDDEEEEEERRGYKRADEEEDMYATMVYKDQQDDSSLPPLLQRVPKDFGAVMDDDDEDYDGGDFSRTMIVKTNRNRSSPSTSSATSMRRMRDSPFGDRSHASPRKRMEEEENFSTFVVKSTVRSSEESLTGTVIRRTGSGGGGSYSSSTMSKAVVSMQAVGELGFGKQRKGSSSSQGEENRQQLPRKMSVSSIPESITREDPSSKYELLNELGKGSYGAVYKARDLKTSELVAIKVISLSEGEEGYEEIRGEIEMLQQCSHPNVVRYLGSYQGEEYLWIVMEYCGGGSVADLMNINDEPLEEHQIAYICREALKGLSYLHSIFKVHRDIKGGNILLTEQGEVKLGDFGVAAQLTRTMSKRNTVYFYY